MKESIPYAFNSVLYDLCVEILLSVIILWSWVYLVSGVENVSTLGQISWWRRWNGQSDLLLDLHIATTGCPRSMGPNLNRNQTKYFMIWRSIPSTLNAKERRRINWYKNRFPWALWINSSQGWEGAHVAQDYDIKPSAKMRLKETLYT